MNPWLHRRQEEGPLAHRWWECGGRSGKGCECCVWCVQASWCTGGAKRKERRGGGGLHRGAADWRPLGVTRDSACEVDMREVSWRPVRSEDEMLTGAPLCRRMLTFLSFSIPV